MYIGSSEVVRTLRHKIEKVASTKFPILITGETGVGKGVVAREIHNCATGPFVKVDCASLVSTLVETELQGHVRGAFTGAESSRKGLFSAADGGTLFLDEVGELTSELQAKFLTVLQDRVVRPIGSVVGQSFDCRIISATNRDLRADVENGRFRRDLYYRLKVISIKVPPLREHLEDVPDLLRHFLSIHAPPGFAVSDRVLARFMTHHWPGNVRELESCLQTMVALAEGSTVSVDDMPSQLLSRSWTSRMADSTSPASKAVISKQLVLSTIKAAGSKSRAARILNIGRSTLYRHLGRTG